MVMLFVVAMVVPIHKPMAYIYQHPVLMLKQYLMLFNKFEECPQARCHVFFLQKTSILFCRFGKSMYVCGELGNVNIKRCYSCRSDLSR